MSTTTLHDTNEAARRMRRSVSWIYHNKGQLKYTQTCPGAPIYFTDEQIEWAIADAAREPAAKSAPAKVQREVKPKPEPRPQLSAGATVINIPVSRPGAARGGRKNKRRTA